MAIDEIAQKRFEKALAKKLSTDEITANLQNASLFLVAYELLKIEIIDNTRAFFVSGFDHSSPNISDEYNSKVLSLDRNRFRASCLWLAKSGAIEMNDVEIAQRIREHRHEVAHELPRLLTDTDAKIDISLFQEARRLLVLIGRFWGRIEVDTNPDFDGGQVYDEEINSGAMILMDYIMSVIGESET